MNRFLALVLALAPFTFPVSAQVNVWQPQGVVIATSGSVFPAQPSVQILASGCAIVSSPCFAMVYTCFTTDICYTESLNGKTGWTNLPGNPVVTGAAYPKMYLFSGTFYMYTTLFGSNAMAVHTSPDMRTWTLQNASALVISQPWETSGKFIGQPGIFGPVAGIYYAYYAAFDTSLNCYAQGQATSTDLIHWTKNASNPLITTGCPSNFHWQQIGTLFYGWSQIVQAGIPGDPSDPALPSDISRYQGASVNGPWTLFPTSTFYRTRTEEGVGLVAGQVADPWMMEVGTCTSTANCSVYMYYTISTDGESNTTSQISLAIAPNQTFASLLTSYEGVQNVPIPTTTGLALNCSSIATDTFIRANANPIGGNWSTLSTVAGHGAMQLNSNAAYSSTTPLQGDSYWNATSFPNDQCASITLVGSFSAGMSTGAYLRATTVAGVPTAYLGFLAGTSSATGVFHMAKYISGTFTSFYAGSGVPVASGEVDTYSAIQNNLCIYQNANLIQCAQDSSIAAGASGMEANPGTNAATFNGISSWTGAAAENAPSINISSQIGAFLVSRARRENKPLIDVGNFQ